MMKKTLAFLLAALLITVLSACSTSQAPASSEAPYSALQSAGKDEPSMSTEAETTNALGALTPEAALTYMKETENLVIVDVATTSHYNAEHFEGAMHIPIEELDSEAEDALYMDIPAGRPVLLHCRRGMIVPGAYARVLELRPDIPEVSYIDGAPLFSD